MGENVQDELAKMKADIMSDKQITVHTTTELAAVDGFVGNFTSTLVENGEKKTLRHGVAVVATGAGSYKPTEYLYGKDPRVVTHHELDQRFINKDPKLKDINSAVFIQCVGSREPGRPYCSRVCCTHSLESAVSLKELRPDMDVYILYRDIRSYGLRELIYEKARKLGVKFIRFNVKEKRKSKRHRKD
jgi:heterodisulfide reductase subunit A